MGSQQGNTGGHACIVVGRARRIIEHSRQCIQVNRLVELLRQEGVPEENLQSVAVMVHPYGSDFTDLPKGGGLYYHGVKVKLHATSQYPEQIFTTVIHLSVPTAHALSYLVLHEAGHVHAATRGKFGRALFGPRPERWLRRVGKAVYCLSALAAIAWLAATMSAGMPIIVAMIGVLVGMTLATVPHMVLWWLSPCEWRAVWFQLRHRHLNLVGSVSDGTPVRYIDRFVVRN